MKAEDIKQVASIGGGVIGSSWTTLFAFRGLKVYQYDINDECIEKCKEQVETVERGQFGADMKVSLINDGPFTIILDSDNL